MRTKNIGNLSISVNRLMQILGSVARPDPEGSSWQPLGTHGPLQFAYDPETGVQVELGPDLGIGVITLKAWMEDNAVPFEIDSLPVFTLPIPLRTREETRLLKELGFTQGKVFHLRPPAIA